MNFYCWL